MKKELTLIEITQDREFLSELSALIKMNGILTIANGRLSLSFQTENASIARRMYSLIKYFYKVHINISVRKKLKLKKNNVYICRLDQDVKAILTDLYILNDDYTMRLDIAEELIDTEEKKKAYLTTSRSALPVSISSSRGVHAAANTGASYSSVSSSCSPCSS